jgi:hypothetical protein
MHADAYFGSHHYTLSLLLTGQSLRPFLANNTLSLCSLGAC